MPSGTLPTLRSRWGKFLSAVLDPWILVLFAVAAYLAYSAAQQKDPLDIALLAVLAALSSGILGAVATRRWEALAEERTLVARGRAAVRGLKLLLAGIADLERRTQVYLLRQAKPPKAAEHPEPQTMAFEEIVGRCRALAEEAVSAVENWTDIVPEADIKTQIGVISDLLEARDSQADELHRLRDVLEQSKNQSEAEKAELKKEIERKEKVLRDTKRQLATTQSAVTGTTFIPGSTLFSGSLPSGPSLADYLNPERTCERCGKKYREPLTLWSSATASMRGNVCPECRAAGR